MEILTVTGKERKEVKKLNGTKLVIYFDEKGEEKQVVSPDMSKFTNSYDNCKKLAQAIAGNRKVYNFEMI